MSDSISLWGSVGTGKGQLRVNGRAVSIAPNGGFATFVAIPSGPSPALRLEARRGSIKIAKVVPLVLVKKAPAPPLVVRQLRGWRQLRRLPSDTVDSATQARPIYSRWTPGGALALALPQGARLPVDGETDDAIRVRLADGILVWVPRAEIGPAAPALEWRRSVSDLRLTVTGGRSTIDLAVTEPLPSVVEVLGARMQWTLFGAKAGRIDEVRVAEGVVRTAAARDRNDGRVVIEVLLRQPPLGWRTGWRNGRATLEVRLPRHPDAGLAGLVVALDPGHPPEGTTGPTGLKEDSLTLAVAQRAAVQLRSLGAQPLLTRATSDPVSLEARVAAAEAADADLLVSIHANAPGEGRPPWSVDGTRVYWLLPHASFLARVMRDSVALAMRQMPAGTIESNLAVLRSAWFPSVLIEATALTMPAREAYLRSEAGIEAYASGIISGISGWVAMQSAAVARMRKDDGLR